MNRTIPLAIAALALAGCASPAADAPAAASSASDAPASSAPVCINPARIQKQTIVSDEEIRFELAGREVWSNKLKTKCHGLKSQGGFSWDVRGASVCSNQQTIYVLTTGVPCSLGEFTRLPDAP